MNSRQEKRWPFSRILPGNGLLFLREILHLSESGGNEMKQCYNLVKWMVIRMLVVSICAVIGYVPGRAAVDDSVIQTLPAKGET